MPGLADKCLGSMRTGTRKAALELVLLYAENEKEPGCEGLIADLVQRLSSKQPKVVAANVAALAALVQTKDSNHVHTASIMPCLPTIFAHADKNVRAEGTTLAIALYRAVGSSSFRPVFAKLKDIQVKELEQRFSEADTTAPTMPERRWGSASSDAQPAAAAAAAAAPTPSTCVDRPGPPSGHSGAASTVRAPTPPPVDPYDTAEPVNVLEHRALSSNFFEKVTAAKWQERMEALESLHTALTSTIRIDPDPGLDAYVQALQVRIQKDANINVVLQACRCIEALAKGLRTHGAPYMYVIPTLLDKLKERKPSTVDVLASTLDALYACGTWRDILEPVAHALQHKNPAVKGGTVRFVGRCLASSTTTVRPAEVKDIAPLLVPMMSDGAGDVRDAAAQALGALVAKAGERAMAVFLEPLDDIKKAKIREEAGSMQPGPAPRPQAPPASASHGAAAPAPSTPRSARPTPKPVRGGTPSASPARPTPRPPPAAASTAAAEKAAPQSMPPRPTPSSTTTSRPTRPTTTAPPRAARAPTSTKDAHEPIKFEWTPESAEAHAAETLPASIVSALRSSNWKERLEGAQSLRTWIQDEQPTCEWVARFLAKHPSWKESNFQVMGEVFQSMQALASLPQFERSTVALTVQPLCEKLGDLKLKAAAGETLCQYAEVTSLGCVIAQVLPVLASLKAPKAQAEALTFLDQTILAFGIQGVDLRELVTYVATMLKSANAQVRGQATQLFCTLARYTGGSAVLNLLPEITPQLRATLETQVAHAAPPPAPTRGVRTAPASDTATEATATEASTASAAPTAMDEDAMEQLMPRVDVDGLVPASVFPQTSDTQWKVRKAALETIQSALQPHTRLKGSGMELAQALKPRMQDTNIMVRQIAMDVVRLLAQGMHGAFEPLARVLAAPVTQVLADAKAPIRAAAATTLSAMVSQCGLAPLIGPMGQVLDGKGANPMLREDLYTWLETYLTEHADQVSSWDLTPILSSVLHALDDRAAPVRKHAQALLPFLVQSVGYKAMVEGAQSLKGASRATALPLIDGARSATAAASKHAASAAPTLRAHVAPSAMPKASSAAPRARVAPSKVAAPATPAARRAAVPTAKPLARVAPSSTSRDSAVPAARALKPSAVSRTLAAAAPRGPTTSTPFRTSELKYKAAREKMARAPFMIDGVVRPHDAETLRQQMEVCCSPTLVQALFSKDHNAERDYLHGLSVMQSALAPAHTDQDANAAALAVANSDVIIKYSCLRLTDNNTSVALRCFELLSTLLRVLETQGYHLHDAEAHALIPALILRTGDAKAVFREQARSILQRITVLFPPSRLLHMLVDQGLASKNARTRAECLSEVGVLLSRHGLAICTPAKTLPVMARFIGDRDANVRNAALTTLAEAYKLEGDDIWRLIGPLPSKDEALLEERLKRTHAAPPPSASSASAAAAKPTATPRTVPSIHDGELRDLALVRSDDKETSIAGLKAMQEHLTHTEQLAAHESEALVQSVLMALGHTVQHGMIDHRYVKHVLQTVLVLLEAQRTESSSLPASSIAPLLEGLLHTLMDVSADEDDEASQTLAKQLNAVVLRILSTCQGDAVYEALFTVLTHATQGLQMGDDEQARFGELVVKCLWKVARKLPAALESQSVHGDVLLATVERFFVAIPPSEWGRRAREHMPLRDIPLITATNVLKQLTDTLQDRALALTDTWDDPENSHVYRYLLRLLYGSSSKATTTSSISTSQSEEASSSSTTPSLPDDPLTTELCEIFERISQKDQSRAAIRDLYEFQKRHPSMQAHIERSLQNTGPIFQRYIKRALANHAADDPSPAPTSTTASSSTPSVTSSHVDARLAELKAKFRSEPGEAKNPDQVKKRMSMSTEALRSRLAAMRTDDAAS